MRRIETVCGSVLFVACVCACAASNPERKNVPAPWQPPPKVAAEKSAPANPAPADAAGTTAAVASDAKPAPARVEEPVIVRVAGEPVYVSELLAQWLYLDNFRVLEQIDNLVVGRIIYLEAQRLRVRIDPDEDAHAYDQAVKAIETEIGRKSSGVTLDSYVDRVMGLDPIRYRERLRDDARRSLLGNRVTRAWLLQQEHVALHVIVVDSEDDAKVVQKDLADGIAFEDVARKRSVDAPSKAAGGEIAPIVSRNVPLGKLAFETPVGSVGGPIRIAGKWVLLRVDARPTAIEGDWSRIGAAVEESLKKRHMDAQEVQQWRDAMGQRYEVDTRPFLELVREPVH